MILEPRILTLQIRDGGIYALDDPDVVEFSMDLLERREDDRFIEIKGLPPEASIILHFADEDREYKVFNWPPPLPDEEDPDDFFNYRARTVIGARVRD